jgi:uncharacterized protein (DUF2267 family)
MQQREVNVLMAGINAAISSPFNMQAEMLQKQQQQIQLQTLLKQINNQKAMQSQMQSSDPAMARVLEERIRQNEIQRLSQELNRPITSSNPAIAAQQSSIKSQQLDELR